MADRAELSSISSGAPVDALSSTHRKASVWIAAVLVVAALALAACNAPQQVNPSSQRTLANIYPNYSAYNPIEYAQTSGFYGGR